MSEGMILNLLYMTIAGCLFGLVYMIIKEKMRIKQVKRECDLIAIYIRDELHLDGQINICDVLELDHTYFVEVGDKHFAAVVYNGEVHIYE